MGQSKSKQQITNTTYSQILTNILTESTSTCSASLNSTNSVIITNSKVRNLKVQQITAASIDCLMSSNKKQEAIAKATNDLVNSLGNSLGGIALSRESKQNVTNSLQSIVKQNITDKTLTELKGKLELANELKITNSDVSEAVIIQKATGSAKLVNDYFAQQLSDSGIANDISNQLTSVDKNQLAEIIDSTGNAAANAFGGIAGVVDSAGNVVMTPVYYFIGFLVVLLLVVLIFRSSGSSNNSNQSGQVRTNYNPQNNAYMYQNESQNNGLPVKA